MLKVVKFGGSSMADAGQYAKIKDIILADPSRKVVIVSAAGKRFSGDHKLTDLLYLCHAHLQYGVACDPVYDMICQRYIEIRDQLKLNVDLEQDFADLRTRMENGISQDELVSRGEYFSAKLMAAYLGYEFLDAAEWLRFNMDGTVDSEATYSLLQEKAAGKAVVIPGFYGTMPDSTIRTFSRGGSDITGALAAAALDADIYENWTDVSGILMADPRIVKNAKPIDQVTYAELRELSFIGAQVLHEDTIFPVREKGIPLNIRNTNAPDDPGTMIMEEVPDNGKPDDFITGIAGKKGFVSITLTKRNMSSTVGEFRKTLSVFERHKISVDYTNTSIDCFTVVVAEKALAKQRYAVLADLQNEMQPDAIEVTENISVVAVVGRKMVFRTGASGRIFAALGQQGVNIRMIAQGPLELNIIIGVDTKDYEKAVQTLYDAFAK